MQANLQPKPWLPDDALNPDRITPLLDSLLADWSNHWFASEHASASATFQDDWPGGGANMQWRSVPDLASLALTQNLQTALVSAMLGCTIPPGSVQANDREVIGNLATSVIDDLLVRLGGLAGMDVDVAKPIGEAMGLDDARTWEISFRSGRRAFKIAISRDGLVNIMRRSLPQAVAPKLASVRTGLAEQQVELVADLGRSSVALVDLEDLGVGDILVLERTDADRVELLVNGARSPFGGLLDSVEGQTCVVLKSIKDEVDV